MVDFGAQRISFFERQVIDVKDNIQIHRKYVLTLNSVLRKMPSFQWRGSRAAKGIRL
jgi:hypothetical protein